MVIAAVFCVTGVAQNQPAERPFGAHDSFAVDKAALRAAGASAALVDSVSNNAFKYFRLLSRQFAARSCYEFQDLRWRLPSVAVHGDPHVEQFVTTTTSYGLEDFDRAGFGPAVVDLIRYGSSLHVACRQMHWSCDAEQAVAAYFSAYRAALDHPVARTPPQIVARLRAATAHDTHAWLQWAESLMLPMPAGDEQNFRRGWPRFVQLMRETYPARPESYYRIVRIGALQMGVGSALETKVLIRIAGPSADPDDDVVLEARPTSTGDGTECVSRPVHGGSLHVLMFSALLGPRMPEVFGFVPREGAREAPELWVQSWDSGYRELSLSNLQSQRDLNELAVDAATQLAGHFWTEFPEPLRAHQRFAQLRAFEMTESRARQAVRTFTAETLEQWQRFRSQP